jgi:DNA-binding CsgD family transcriptional regulator
VLIRSDGQAGERLLERDEQLSQISESFSAAAAGTGRLLVVEGRGGMGKSALLGAAAEAGRGEGVAVLAARGSDLEREFAFGIALQLFERTVIAQSTEGREELLAGAAGLADALFRGAPVDGDAYGIIHGLYWLTSNLCRLGDGLEGFRPVALLIDDAHWADDLSLRFLLRLAERIEELPLVVAVAFRPPEPGTAAPLLRRLAGANNARVVAVDPLSESAVRSLVRDELWADADEVVCRSCATVTGGNPFLVHALVAELRASGVRPSSQTAEVIGQLAPGSVLRAVVARLARLVDRCRDLAKSVAVLGDDVPLRHAAAVAGFSESEAVDAVAGLVGSDILAAREPLCFAHPLIRSAVTAEMSDFEAGRMHLKAAQVLRDDDVEVERVAAHLMAAPPTRQAWAIEILRSAAARAQHRGAASTAADLLVRALEEGPGRDDRVKILRELGAAETFAGRPTAAARLDEALGLVVDDRQRLRVAIELGYILYGSGRRADAQAVLEQVMIASGEEATAEAHELRVLRLAAALFPESDHDPGDLGARTDPSDLDPARPIDRLTLALLALLQASDGRPAHDVRPLTSRALNATTPYQDGERRLWEGTLAILSPALILVDDLPGCQRLSDAALDDARRRGSQREFVACSYLRAWPLYLQGRLSEVVAEVEAAMETLDRGWWVHAAGACAVLAHTHMARGDLDAAALTLERAEAAGLATGAHERAQLADARGTLELLCGHPQTALEQLTLCGELQASGDSMALLRWRPPAAAAALAAGDTGRALQLVDEELLIAQRAGTARALGTALRSKGLVVGGHEGLDLLDEAVRVLRSSPALLERSRALIDFGAALRRNNQRVKARRALLDGADLAQRLGAAALAEHAREELRAAGGKPRRLAVSGTASLTPSEFRVATLVARGLTNRQVAQSLFVSVKTVEGHLAHIYDKLSITSRRQIKDLLRTEIAQQ